MANLIAKLDEPQLPTMQCLICKDDRGYAIKTVAKHGQTPAFPDLGWQPVGAPDLRQLLKVHFCMDQKQIDNIVEVGHGCPLWVRAREVGK